MKSITLYINEAYENWNMSKDATNFIKDCIYDILSSDEYDIKHESYQDIINLIIDSINELEDDRKYLQLKNILKKYPNTYFKNNINKLIEIEINNFNK